MTYRYILRLSRIRDKEKITVEAWPSRKELATPAEHRRPSFIIGSLSGQRTNYVYFMVKELVNKYGAKKTKTGLTLRFPEKEIQAIVEAYRLGLMLTALSKAKNESQADSIIRYLEGCTAEEIWFWTSKYLGIIKRDTQSEKVIKALTVLAS